MTFFEAFVDELEKISGAEQAGQAIGKYIDVAKKFAKPALYGLAGYGLYRLLGLGGKKDEPAPPSFSGGPVGLPEAFQRSAGPSSFKK